MRKTLLLLLIAGIGTSAQAQNKPAAKPKSMRLTTAQIAKTEFKSRQSAEKMGGSHLVSSASANHLKSRHGVGGEPILPFLGSSANVYGVLDPTTTATTANQACDLIAMTHRENSTNVGNCGTGAYEAAYSADNGTTWDTTDIIFCNQSSRYPNGSIFNPVGNVNPLNAVAVMSGPWTNSSTTGDSWVESVFGSIQLDGSNPHESFWINGTAGVLTENNGNLGFMSSSDDSTVHIIGEGYNVDASGDFTAWQGAVLTTGKFSAALDSMVYTQIEFRPHLVPSIQGFATMTLPYDSDAFPESVPGTAWSQDGKTGYVVIFGNLDSTGYNYGSNQPIVYKTTNSGATWAMMPPFNFATLPTLTQYLVPSSDLGVNTPLWFTFPISGYQGANDSYDLTVDYQGNLHIMGAIISSAYSSPDSAYLIEFFQNSPGYIYDVSTTNGGGWQARFIDSMMTFPFNVVTSSYSTDWATSPSGVVSFGNRLQASRSTDGKRVFCTWTDDYSGLVPDSLIAPDVKGDMFNIATGVETPSAQRTNTENNYYLCVSDIALASGTPDTTYVVPCTIVYPEQVPDDGLEAVNYYYLDSVYYGSRPSAVPTVSSLGFSISQNFPNPFNNLTQFNINLAKESMVSVDVYNMFGQKVYSINSQKMNDGVHLISIDGSGWSSGVYFYRVTVNNQSVTKKMVVQ